MLSRRAVLERSKQGSSQSFSQTLNLSKAKTSISSGLRKSSKGTTKDGSYSSDDLFSSSEDEQENKAGRNQRESSGEPSVLDASTSLNVDFNCKSVVTVDVDQTKPQSSSDGETKKKDVEEALGEELGKDFSERDLNLLLSIPEEVATNVVDQLAIQSIETDSSESSFESRKRRKRIVSHKSRKKFVLESGSDSSNSGTRTTINKLENPNDEWVSEVQLSLEQGSPFPEVCTKLIQNTVLMLRGSSSHTKLASNLQISPDKLTTLLEMLDMVAETVPSQRSSTPEPPTVSRKSVRYPSLKTKLAVTPAIKSNFDLNFDDDSPSPEPPADPSEISGLNFGPQKSAATPSFKYKSSTQTSMKEFLKPNRPLFPNNNADEDDEAMDETERISPAASSPISYSGIRNHSPVESTPSFHSAQTNNSSGSKAGSSKPIKSNFSIDFDMDDDDVPMEVGDGTIDLISDSSRVDTPYNSKPTYQNYSNHNGVSKDNTYSCDYGYPDEDEMNDMLHEPEFNPYYDRSVGVSRNASTFQLSPSPKKTPGLTPKKTPSPKKVRKGANSEDIGDFRGNVTNHGITGEFDGLKFPHSEMMMQVFRSKFGLKSFRPNQLQVVNAAMLGKDCFVLMPTGGGKSLCYQLTALLSPGVTIVVSPLKALILDQVQRLLSLDIKAAHLSGDISLEDQNIIYRKLSSSPPGLKLLYVTPEKLSASGRILDVLNSLYSNRMLARFVIDEAHCVSQWGHDFRPDYTRLGVLKQKFPKVPWMALTATATPRVRSDILNQLGIPNCKWFLSSFNRPNLKYEVRLKKGNAKTFEDLVEMLNSPRLKGESGIVYCLSRKDCDDTAQKLQQERISAISYHAGLTDKQRADAQNKWLNDRVHIVCATIAFGMGIDKPDVRFVIHYSMPKSIEGYYQESGRAGRDGDPAYCILLYSYQDVVRIKRLMMMEKTINQQAMKVHMDNLNQMIAYCENKTDCRRSQQLEYFGQAFGSEYCKKYPATSCDNCLAKVNYKEIDVTEDCKAIVEAVKILSHGRSRNGNFTVLHFAQIFKGLEHKKIKDNNHDKNPLHGRGKKWARSDTERLLRKMVLDEYLREELIVTRDEIALSYARLGPKAADLMNGKVRVMFQIVDSGKLAAEAQNNSVNMDTSLEGQIGQLQHRCFKELIQECRKISENLKCTFNAVMSIQTLRAMSIELPETPEQMLQVPGVTKANLDKYGAQLLNITVKYSAERFMLMADAAEKQIDEGATQGPSTSRNGNSGRATQEEWRPDDDEDVGSGWINTGKASGSKYYGRKKKTAAKKPTRNFWKFKGGRKSTAGRGRPASTPRKSAASPAAAKKKAPAKPSGGLGLMPLPLPKR